MKSTWLDNLKVSKKLSIGFGLILLGVLTVTAIGYLSTNLLIERLGKAAKVSEVKADALSLRIAAQAYTAKPDASNSQATRSLWTTWARPSRTAEASDCSGQCRYSQRYSRSGGWLETNVQPVGR
ncbi:hypothetical protein [Pseudomonas amygdali]|uniref:CHASE3 domain-containing protein n=1 Tax=Pseudomonas amygdali TaxID=47877 RepID=UPI0039A39A34